MHLFPSVHSILMYALFVSLNFALFKFELHAEAHGQHQSWTRRHYRSPFIHNKDNNCSYNHWHISSTSPEVTNNNSHLHSNILNANVLLDNDDSNSLSQKSAFLQNTNLNFISTNKVVTTISKQYQYQTNTRPIQINSQQFKSSEIIIDKEPQDNESELKLQLECDEPLVCDDNAPLVCASDGYIYESICELRQRACRYWLPALRTVDSELCLKIFAQRENVTSHTTTNTNDEHDEIQQKFDARRARLFAQYLLELQRNQSNNNAIDDVNEDEDGHALPANSRSNELTGSREQEEEEEEGKEDEENQDHTHSELNQQQRLHIVHAGYEWLKLDCWHSVSHPVVWHRNGARLREHLLVSSADYEIVRSDGPYVRRQHRSRGRHHRLRRYRAAIVVETDNNTSREHIVTIENTPLVLHHVRTYMSANYTCHKLERSTTSQLRETINTHSLASHTVRVVSEPHVVLRPTRGVVRALAGGSTNFECQFETLGPTCASTFGVNLNNLNGGNNSNSTCDQLIVRWFLNDEEIVPHHDSQMSSAKVGAKVSSRASIIMGASRLRLDSLEPSDSGAIWCRTEVTPCTSDQSLYTIRPLVGAARVVLQVEQPAATNIGQLNDVDNSNDDDISQNDDNFIHGTTSENDLEDNNESNVSNSDEQLWVFHQSGITVYGDVDNTANVVYELASNAMLAPSSGQHHHTVGNNNKVTLCGGLSINEIVLCEWSTSATWWRPLNNGVELIAVGQPNLARVLVFNARTHQLEYVIRTQPYPQQLWTMAATATPFCKQQQQSMNKQQQQQQQKQKQKQKQKHQQQRARPTTNGAVVDAVDDAQHQQQKSQQLSCRNSMQQESLWVLAGQKHTTMDHSHRSQRAVIDHKHVQVFDLLPKDGAAASSSLSGIAGHIVDDRVHIVKSGVAFDRVRSLYVGVPAAAAALGVSLGAEANKGVGVTTNAAAAERGPYAYVAYTNEATLAKLDVTQRTYARLVYLRINNDSTTHSSVLTIPAAVVADSVRDTRRQYTLSLSSSGERETTQCLPLTASVSAPNALLVVQCAPPVWGQLSVDTVSDTVIGYEPRIRAAQRLFVSPDHKYLLSVDTSTNGKSITSNGMVNNAPMGGSMVFVQTLTHGSVPTFQYDVRTTMTVLDCAFVWTNGYYSALLLATTTLYGQQQQTKMTSSSTFHSVDDQQSGAVRPTNRTNLTERHSNSNNNNLNDSNNHKRSNLEVLNLRLADGRVELVAAIAPSTGVNNNQNNDDESIAMFDDIRESIGDDDNGNGYEEDYGHDNQRLVARQSLRLQVSSQSKLASLAVGPTVYVLDTDEGRVRARLRPGTSNSTANISTIIWSSPSSV
ncbi:hypothetical protein GZH46_00987, partial [Fragariocoptes setiger]